MYVWGVASGWTLSFKDFVHKKYRPTGWQFSSRWTNWALLSQPITISKAFNISLLLAANRCFERENELLTSALMRKFYVSLEHAHLQLLSVQNEKKVINQTEIVYSWYMLYFHLLEIYIFCYLYCTIRSQMIEFRANGI